MDSSEQDSDENGPTSGSDVTGWSYEGGDSAQSGSDQASNPYEASDYLEEYFVSKGSDIFGCHAPVYCCKADTQHNLIALGTGDNRFFLLSCTDEPSVLLVHKFNDSVCEIQFSVASRQYVAAGDMSGLIKVWDIDRPLSTHSDAIWSVEVSDLTILRWYPRSNALFAGTTDGELWLFNIPHGESRYFRGDSLSNLVTLDFLANPLKCVASFDDGVCKQFHLKEQFNTISCQLSVEPLCSVINKSTSRLFIGSQCGKIIVVTLREGQVFKSDEIICCSPNLDRGDRFVESLDLNRSESMLCAGLGNGQVLFFTVSDRALYSQYISASDNGGERSSVVKLKYGLHFDLVIIAYFDGTIRQIDARTCQDSDVKILTRFSGPVLDFDLIDERQLIAASEGGLARVVQL